MHDDGTVVVGFRFSTDAHQVEPAIYTRDAEQAEQYIEDGEPELYANPYRRGAMRRNLQSTEGQTNFAGDFADDKGIVWREELHPRAPAGSGVGGQFAPKAGGPRVPSSPGQGMLFSRIKEEIELAEQDHTPIGQAKQKALFEAVAQSNIPKEQLHALLSGDDQKLHELKGEAHASGKAAQAGGHVSPQDWMAKQIKLAEAPRVQASAEELKGEQAAALKIRDEERQKRQQAALPPEAYPGGRSQPPKPTHTPEETRQATEADRQHRDAMSSQLDVGEDEQHGLNLAARKRARSRKENAAMLPTQEQQDAARKQAQPAARPAEAQPEQPKAAQAAEKPQQRGRYEWRLNKSGKWAWFEGDKQITGAYPTQDQADYAFEVHHLQDESAEKPSAPAESFDQHPQFKRLDSVYGKMSKEQIDAKIDSMSAEIAELQHAGRREFTGTGTRRSGAAMSAQGAREVGEEKLLLSVYRKHKFGDGTTPPAQEPPEPQDPGGFQLEQGRAKLGRGLGAGDKTPETKGRQALLLDEVNDDPGQMRFFGGEAERAKVKAEIEGEAADPQATLAAEEAKLKQAEQQRDKVDPPQAKEASPERSQKIEAVLSAAKKPLPDIVERFELMGTDGKWHFPEGFPEGVKSTGERRSAGFVYRSPEGTTYGKRGASREELEQRHTKNQEEETARHRQALEEMDDDRLQAQHDFFVGEQEKKARLSAPPPSKQPPKDKTEAQRLKELKAIRFKTAGHELEIERLERRAKIDTSKWQEGHGVGYYAGPAQKGRPGSQINRGFQVVAVDPDNKTATIRQVADTGLTVTGGDSDRIGEQVVGLDTLVRDKKYDRPEKHPPGGAKAPGPTGSLEEEEEKLAAAEAKRDAVEGGQTEPAAEEPSRDIPAHLHTKPDELPYESALRAHSGTSFVPEKRAKQRQQEYADTLNSDYAELSKLARTDDERKLLDEEFTRYKSGLKDKTMAYLGASSRVVSTMIAGPSNFPSRQMQKRGDSQTKRLNELIDFRKRAMESIRKKLRPEDGPIKSADPKAVDLLHEKLKQHEELHARMKAMNAAHAKFLKDPASLDKSDLSEKDKERVRNYKPAYSWEPHPFPPYALSNNSAEIRRIKDRIGSVSAMKESEHKEEDRGGVKLVENPEAGRVQLVFPGKPDEATRTKLKAAGFRWSPTEGAWQRHLNNAGRDAAERVLKQIKGEKPDLYTQMVEADAQRLSAEEA